MEVHCCMFHTEPEEACIPGTCEVEIALGMQAAHPTNVQATKYLSWINIDGWNDFYKRTITGHKMVVVEDSAYVMYEKR
jgi:hypothetical protein